ncbi:MAG TPA: copper resistance protein CopC, partial [Chloroflexia bacterium]|nr:copper resistance protein CopC [Chloroflexia bacterium]
MRIRNILAACLLAASLAFMLTGHASAHSLLVSSDPASGAKLATAPSSVQMTFSEGVEPAFSSFIVIDRTRAHFEVGTPAIDRVGGVVTVPLQANLAPGDYVVQWKVVSVVDGHLTKGSFAFNVQGAPGASTTPVAGGTDRGTPEPTAEAEPFLPSGDEDAGGESNAPGVLDVAVRWLGILLAAFVTGGAFFRLVIIPGALALLPEGQAESVDTRTRLDMRFLYISVVATVLLLLTLGAELVLQAVRATETDVLSVFGEQGVLGAVLSSSFGSSLEWRAVTVLVILVLLVRALVIKRTERWLWGLVALAGVAYFWAQTGSAHATALSEEPGAGILQALAPLSNVVHLLATAIWIGGILYFVITLLPIMAGLAGKSRGVLLRESVTRFSQLAIVTVPIVALSGTILYLAVQPSVESTLNTGYGREVLIKVGLLALLMIPAAYNLRKVGPGLAKLRDKMGPAVQALAQGFRRSIRMEALLVSLVVVFSALLTLSAPATDPSAYAGNSGGPTAVASPTVAVAVADSPTPAASSTPVPPSTLTLTQTVRGVDVTLAITHSLAEDDLRVGLVGPKGPISACGPTPGPDDDCALSVKLTLTELTDNSSQTVDALEDGKGAFAVPAGPYLPFDDTWQVVVAVRRWNQPEDVKAAYRMVISETGMTGKASDYVNVDVSTNPSPPASGQVALIFHLTDNNSAPIND